MEKESTNRYANAIELSRLLHLLPEKYFIKGKMITLLMDGDFIQYKQGKQGKKIVFEVKDRPIREMITKALDFLDIDY